MDFKFIFFVLLYCRQSSADSTGFCNFFDPCEQHYSLYQPQRRQVGCKYQQDLLCDDLMSSTWYRVNEPMVNVCPGKSSCGTLYPVWLDGTEPTMVGEMKHAEVCVVGLSNCCERQYQIQMKRCEDFVAYCLPNVKGCPERYCFGNTSECEWLPNQSTKMTTTRKPITTTMKISTTKLPKPDSTTKESLPTLKTTRHEKHSGPTTRVTKTASSENTESVSRMTPGPDDTIIDDLRTATIEIILSMCAIFIVVFVGVVLFIIRTPKKSVRRGRYCQTMDIKEKTYKPTSTEKDIETIKYDKF